MLSKSPEGAVNDAQAKDDMELKMNLLLDQMPGQELLPKLSANQQK